MDQVALQNPLVKGETPNAQLDSFVALQYFRPLFREQKANLAFFIGAGINPNWASPYTQIYANTSDILSSTEQIFINDLFRLLP